jgi:hypothetical protein
MKRHLRLLRPAIGAALISTAAGCTSKAAPPPPAVCSAAHRGGRTGLVQGVRGSVVRMRAATDGRRGLPRSPPGSDDHDPAFEQVA